MAFFGKLKKAQQKILIKWKLTKEGQKETTIPKSTFLKVLREMHDEILQNSSNNIKVNFKACGIVLFNPEEGLKHFPPEQKTSAETGEMIESSFETFLRECWFMSMPHASGTNATPAEKK